MAHDGGSLQLIPKLPVASDRLSAPDRANYNPQCMSTIEIEGLAKSYRVYQKKEGLRASIAGLFRREHPGASGSGHRFARRRRGVGRLPRPQRRGQDDHAQAALGRDHAHLGDGPRAGHIPWKRENAYRRRFALVMGQKTSSGGIYPRKSHSGCISEIYRIDADQLRQGGATNWSNCST